MLCGRRLSSRRPSPAGRWLRATPSAFATSSVRSSTTRWRPNTSTPSSLWGCPAIASPEGAHRWARRSSAACTRSTRPSTSQAPPSGPVGGGAGRSRGRRGRADRPERHPGGCLGPGAPHLRLGRPPSGRGRRPDDRARHGRAATVCGDLLAEVVVARIGAVVTGPAVPSTGVEGAARNPRHPGIGRAAVALTEADADNPFPALGGVLRHVASTEVAERFESSLDGRPVSPRVTTVVDDDEVVVSISPGDGGQLAGEHAGDRAPGPPAADPGRSAGVVAPRRRPPRRRGRAGGRSRPRCAASGAPGGPRR